MANKITLLDIFETPLQVKILEILLDNPDEYFTVNKMARIVNASPAAVSKRIEKLERIGVIKLIEGVKKTKIFKLNEEKEIVVVLIEFYNSLTKFNNRK